MGALVDMEHAERDPFLMSRLGTAPSVYRSRLKYRPFLKKRNNVENINSEEESS